jgi:hypothetical protein
VGRRRKIHGYADRSVNARLAASLLASEEWVRIAGLDAPAVLDAFEHLWEWPAIRPHEFDRWYAWSNDALTLGKAGGAMSPPLRDAARRADVPESDLRVVLEHTTAAVYDNLFAAVHKERSLMKLKRLSKVVWRYGITFPPVSLFHDEPYSLNGGWGRKMSPDEARAWRETLHCAWNGEAEA